VVKDIHWQTGEVEAITENGVIYKASRAVIALPLGILQAGQGEKGAVTFSPDIPKQNAAINAMGFGAVIKILLEFSESFWMDELSVQLADKSLDNMGYLFSDEAIPTWWTQAPEQSKVLTGWIGGPPAAEKQHMRESELLKLSLQSLANIFNRNADELKKKLIAFNVVNWTAEPFTRGSYAYDTVGAHESRKILSDPVNDTLFFAGEYLYEGPAMGTVEAALTSGRDVAERIMIYR